MRRPPKLIAIACIAVVLLTAATPALWAGLSVVLLPLDPIFQPVNVEVAAAPHQDVRFSPFPFFESPETRGPPVL